MCVKHNNKLYNVVVENEIYSKLHMSLHKHYNDNNNSCMQIKSVKSVVITYAHKNVKLLKIFYKLEGTPWSES